MNYFIVIAIFIVQLRLTTAVSPDLNTQQVFSSSELPSDVEIFSNYTFERMVQPEDCSYSNLTKCHTDEDLHNDYHLRCYIDVCPRKHYYCLDKPNDNNVHICGKADKCHKRGRNIAVTTPKDMENIIVYSIPCRPGYAQMNSVNCFSPCEKDDSIIARATAGTDGKRALARCHAEEGYCNEKCITYFQIGSSEDECVVADDDLGIRCDITEDLMPDCSCTTKCKSNEERDWHESLMCKPKEEIPVTENAHSVETSSVTDRITPPENESFSEHQTPSYERESIQPEKDKEKDKADNDSNNLGTGAYIAIFVLLGLLFVCIIYVTKLKRNSNKRRVVTLLKKEFVNNQFNIHKSEDVKLNFESSARSSHDSLLRNQKIDNMDTPKANDRVAQEPSYEEQMMLNLKIPPDGQNVSDSGMYIEDETTAKRQDGETQKDAAKLVQ
ncbi:uncharacterized protein LOC132755658 [Ruditapes philippinarum]|uniref:uncharacterized protein LOC132755658 n=1 Tax=Ruditapes philippinarum TaxID=129788 RepID=UPI00295A74CF|nr:uncharacterized protein LOC132755658 [Ruditapes philippinarum]